MSTTNEVFATAVNCMDGRTVYAVAKYFEDNYGIKYVDTITDAGPVQHCHSEAELERVRFRVVEVSIGRHGSKHVAVIAHEECAGNPISKAEQLEQLLTYVETVKSWLPDDADIEVFGLWCQRTETDWTAIPLSELE